MQVCFHLNELAFIVLAGPYPSHVHQSYGSTCPGSFFGMKVGVYYLVSNMGTQDERMECWPDPCQLMSLVLVFPVADGRELATKSTSFRCVRNCQ